jgi:gliding motility-associated-like protein
VLGNSSQAQTGNLIYNGDFEQWDSTKYLLNDFDDLDLCKLYNGTDKNGEAGAWCIKGINYAYWPNPFDSTLRYLAHFRYPNAYYLCHPGQYLIDNLAIDMPKKNSKTFVITSFELDTIRLIYQPKFFLYMPLIKPMKKGESYELEFDLAASMMPSPKCDTHNDTTDAYGCSGFGFGFTEKPPTFIVKDHINYETDLIPKVKLGYFNNKNWTSFKQTFSADSNYNFITFGFFDKGLNQNIFSKTPKCQFSPINPARKYVTFLLDNLSLRYIDKKLLPNDTQACSGHKIRIKTVSDRFLNWTINGVSLSKKSNREELIIDQDYTVIATDSIFSDTMIIKFVPKPTFSVLQTDSICNEITQFTAFPDSLKYIWLPENIFSQTARFKGNQPRKAIAIDRYGCSDTLIFIPILSSQVCGTYYIPNAFSPNNDNTNEKFGVIGRGLENVSMEIFNIWGEKLFESKDAEPWDGKYKGTIVDQGIYMYKLKITYWENNKLVIDYIDGTFNLLK